MKLNKVILVIVALFITQLSFSQDNSWLEAQSTKNVQLNVFYFENEPFAYTNDKNQLTGIEIEILNYFKDWVWKNKQVAITYNYIKTSEYDNYLTMLAASNGNAIGAGTVTITEDRKREYQFTAPYLKNISVLVSHGSVPTLSSINDYSSSFSGLRPVTVKGTIHEILLKQVVKASKTDLLPEYVDSPMDVAESITSNPKYYGYIDIISYWKFVKTNKIYIKMHKKANNEDERFAFILPPNSDWLIPLNEFFESGFGFTSTKDYHKILERHLGEEIINFVELD